MPSHKMALVEVHKVTNIEPCALPTSPVCHEKLELSDLLNDLFQGAENVVHETREDTIGITSLRMGAHDCKQAEQWGQTLKTTQYTLTLFWMNKGAYSRFHDSI